MANIPYVAREEASADVQAVYDQMQKQLGAVINIGRLLAHNPGLLQSFMALNSAANHTELDAKLRDLAYLKASQLNNCAYCAHYHRLTGGMAGLTKQQIADVAQSETSDAYDDLQRDVLRYAEQLTCQIHPDGDTLDRLKQRLSNRELMELTFTIGLANLTNRFNVALATELP
jgi:uncharacterized peroxidase-related enzyme